MFQNDEADVNALAPDRIRRVAKHEKFELFQLSHLLTLHRPTRERDVAANSGTERSTPALSLDARSAPAPVFPAHPSHCSTTQAESHLLPSKSSHHPLPRCEIATARMIPTHAPRRTLHSGRIRHVKGNRETSTRLR